MYCKDCGKEINENSVFCNHCGKKLNGTVKKETNANKLPKSGKTKVSAIVLVVLFGFFGWLYTYRVNKNKFWISVAVTFFIYVIYFTMSDLVIGIIILPIAYLCSFGIWLWALLDNAIKPNSFYDNYPNN